MIYEERLLKVLHTLHNSEKSSLLAKKTNTIVLKVAKNASKLEILDAVQNLFKVKVLFVNTLVVKGKTKRRRHKHNIGRSNDWKKAYVTLKKGEVLNFNFTNNVK